jgi:hypothetical protein
MAVNFPASPTNNQTFTSGGITWSYSTSIGAWRIVPNTVVGAQGLQGTTGSTGGTGGTGLQGFQGTTGSTGGTGGTGLQGFQGIQGTSIQGTSGAGGGVTTFSAGSTGFTPSSATAGAVSLAGTLAIASGGTGATTAGAADTALRGFTTTATAGGTTTLTNASTLYQIFTGTNNNQTVQLPVTSTLAQGWSFHIVNNCTGTGTLTVNSSGGNAVIVIPPGITAMVTCILTSGTSAASWEAGLTDFSTYTGTGGVVLATSPTLTTPTISSIVNSGTLTLPTSTDTLVGRATTDTLTNKRVTPRVSTTASSATPSINTDNVDVYGITALTVNITGFTMSGTPTNGQKLWIYIVGTAARSITWGGSFEASTIALPTTTVSTNRLDVGFVWNSVSSRWRCVGSA